MVGALTASLSTRYARSSHFAPAAGFKEHVTALVSLASRWRVQIKHCVAPILVFPVVFDARKQGHQSCLRASRRTVGAMMHMAEFIAASRVVNALAEPRFTFDPLVLALLILPLLTREFSAVVALPPPTL